MNTIEVYLLAREAVIAYNEKTNRIAEIRENFPANPPNPKETCIKTNNDDGLVATVSHLVQAPIRLHSLPWGSKIIMGKLLAYENKETGELKNAEIIYSYSLNRCWARLVICKEAMHLMCDNKDNYTKNPEALVQGLLADTPSGISDEIDIERLAIIGAMECLIPIELEDIIYEAYDSRSLSYYEIALRLLVPKTIVELRLTPSMRSFYERLKVIKTRKDI